MAFRTWRRARRGSTEPVAAVEPPPEPVVETGAAGAAEVPEPAPPGPGSSAPVDVDLTAADGDALLAEADRVLAEDGIFVAMAHLRAANRDLRDPRVDARILALRHEAFAALPPQEGREEWPPRVEDRFAGVVGCPEVTVGELDADLLASAITHHGCLLVRGLVDADGADRLRATIDESFRACDAKVVNDAGTWPGSWFRPFRPGPGYPPPKEGHRGWVRAAGGVLAADSPPSLETVLDMFEQAGLRDVIGGYLGEQPILSVDKLTLRRVPLDLGGAEWHQDGSFLGEGIRTLNVWLALSPCGGDEPSPGLDLVPRRFDAVLPTGADGAWFDWSVGPELVARESVATPVIRPEFAAGDALLFDELFLHRTALEPTMTRERYAIESWFFAASQYPGDSIPIVF